MVCTVIVCRIMAVVYMVPVLREVLSIHLLTVGQFLTIGAFSGTTIIMIQFLKRVRWI
jgi:hypothetical protein